MIFYKQDRFGNDAPPKERGNCDKTCLASFLGISPGEIPDFQELPDYSEWYQQRYAFLATYGLYAFQMNARLPLPPGYCLLVGKSPRGDWDHVVIGKVSDDGYHVDYIHDPHPSNDMLDSIHSAEYILPLPEGPPNALAPDAKRYRWMRNQDNRERAAKLCTNKMNLDKAIDEEME